MKRKQDKIQPESPFLLKPDYDRGAPAVEKMLAGPNRWEEVKQYQYNYGDNFDFRIMDQPKGANEGVFMPCSIAAQEWIRSKVPEGMHWYGDLDGKFWGVHVKFLDIVLEAAEEDGLINEEDYMNAMNDRDARAGE